MGLVRAGRIKWDFAVYIANPIQIQLKNFVIAKISPSYYYEKM